MKICVVGLGLIGGSMAIDLKVKGHHIIGVDKSPSHIEKALELGLVDEVHDLNNALEEAEVVIIAVPVDAIEKVLVNVLDQMNPKAIAIDVGSTKQEICESVKTHSKRGRFVAAHPLAGTEFSGPTAAIPNLFSGKKNIICEEERIDEDALDTALQVFSEIGMTNIFMNPDNHDMHVAYVSHLSHVSAFTLGLTVLDIEKDEKQIFNLASTGFESTVRLAKSSPNTWASIFNKNSNHLAKALDNYISKLQEFKSAIENQDSEKMKALMDDANDIKRVLKGIKLNVVKLS